jgi:hypothetical protein
LRLPVQRGFSVTIAFLEVFVSPTRLSYAGLLAPKFFRNL